MEMSEIILKNKNSSKAKNKETKKKEIKNDLLILIK